ncbi:MAG: hypothetical protein ACREGI_03775 [Candidatus Levyibacteriota bacterium]
MKKSLFSFIVFFGTIIFFLFSMSSSSLATDPYSCKVFRNPNRCISLNMEAKCDSNHNPYIALSWNNPWGDSAFNIVYSRSSTGQWYQFHTGGTSTNIPPSRGGSGSDGSDTTSLKVGETFSGKISGGYPGPGLTTGYSDPDAVSNPVPDCSAPPAATATPTPGPTGSAKINFILGLQGIGLGSGTSNPLTLQRAIKVEVYKPTTVNPGWPGTQNDLLYTGTGTIGFDNSTGYFSTAKGTPVDFGSSFAPGKYQLLLKVDGYLFQLFRQPDPADSTKVTTIFNVNTGITTINTPNVPVLLPGDYATDGGGRNHLSQTDYFSMLPCLGKPSKDDSSASQQCPHPHLADFDDDGTVDIVDLNLFLRSMFFLLTPPTDPNTIIPGVCSGFDCQGD